MLYDPKWEVQAEAGNSHIHKFLAWLERQPARQSYCFTDSGACAYAQFSGRNLYCSGLNEVFPGLALILSRTPNTFGAAAERLRTALAASD